MVVIDIETQKVTILLNKAKNFRVKINQYDNEWAVIHFHIY